MASNTRTTPSIVQFAVGRDPALSASATNQDVIFERVDALGEVLIEVVNHSRTENLVLTLQNGADNLDGGYSTRQTRVAGTLGNSVTVAPLQSATMAVDGPNAAGSQRYWRFRASNQLRAWGTVTVTHARGELVRRSLFPG